MCDEVGMGKTYVAAAIARAYSQVLIVAPAGVSVMWTQALLDTGLRAQFLSFEKLSRTKSDDHLGHELIIVDEAHHARNRTTHRYAELERLARNARVLLLTATPIHNRHGEMLALLSLFMGDRAKALTADELARCVIRREHRQIQVSAPIPEILPVIPLQTSDRADIVDALMNLPPAIAVRDGGVAQALVGRGLVHQWASSEAALQEALRKRIARATALIASLAVGTYPTERELRTWTFADGALQLGFAELLAAPSRKTKPLLLCVTRHRDALQRLLAALDPGSLLDAERATLIRGIRRSHDGEKIVAFAQYAATVTMLFRSLVRLGHVAMLTARGASVAGGRATREEILAHFAPRAFGRNRAERAEEVDVLLTTDLLSEGVNLQDASVIVHLDLPWTAARMEQRVGRAARIGSTNAAVKPYLISPPASAVGILRSDTIVRRKWQIAKRAIGSDNSPPVPGAESPADNPAKATLETPTRLVELLRSILAGWLEPALPPLSEPVVGCVLSDCSGFLACLSVGGQPRLVVELQGETSTSMEAQIKACRAANGGDTEMLARAYTTTIARLDAWFERESASLLAGTASSNLRRRRLLNRIDRAIEDAPPHSRATRLHVASRARRVVVAQQSGAIEAELDTLARSDLQGEDWLAAVASLESPRLPGPREIDGSRPSTASDRTYTVHALLLFRRQSSA